MKSQSFSSFCCFKKGSQLLVKVCRTKYWINGLKDLSVSSLINQLDMKLTVGQT